MVEITARYEGELRTTATHGPSGVTLVTDAPVDNQGKGESFSPTDLCATALVSCMATIMGIKARNLNIDLTGMTMRIEKHMSADPPRRIVSLPVEIHAPSAVPMEQRATLERSCRACPVFQSLHPAIEKTFHFHWDQS
ncbi:OsmC family protein [Cerasicoccus arenae]|uniref:Redox protein n=1 Tax=Cerasicoccus arenae TaxID=424488 RepID=A0A8J3GFP6_9BACT|nr:OsmC family protein [Cerasicoccus arenae]MBK1859295.1 OsmC family protein [Cerasicoccus arenae]GHC13378.1 redox protein [Cerasicoccus arenae]